MADITDSGSLAEVRAYKQQRKAAAKGGPLMAGPRSVRRTRGTPGKRNATGGQHCHAIVVDRLVIVVDPGMVSLGRPAGALAAPGPGPAEVTYVALSHHHPDQVNAAMFPFARHP